MEREGEVGLEREWEDGDGEESKGRERAGDGMGRGMKGNM